MLTKFYYNTMQGSPDLEAEWGSLNDVLKTVLTGDGFNPQNASGVELVEGGAKIILALNHGFIKYQVVSVTGADNEDFNKEYRVKLVTDTYIVVNSDISTPITGSIVVKTPSMGWTEKFTGEHKSVYQPKDTIKNPFLLRVDNSCPVGFNTTWAKFARVTICDGMLDIDNFGDNAKAPCSVEDFDTNEKGNGVTGTNGIYGWAKWYHGVDDSSSGNYLYESRPTGIKSGYKLNWSIVCDDSSLYLIVKIADYEYDTATQDVLYTFTNVKSYNTNDNFNGLLGACDTKKRAVDVSNYMGYDVPFYIDGGKNTSSATSSGLFLLRNYLGIGDYHAEATVFSLSVSGISGYTSSISYPNRVDNSIMLHDVYVKEGSAVRGTMPIIKWVHHKWGGGDKAVLDKGDGLYLILGSQYPVSSQMLKMYFAYQLEW